MRDWIPFLVAGLGAAAGFYGAWASSRATRVNQEANQIKWLQEARTDSISAKREAAEASEEAAEIRRDLVQTRRETVELRDLVEELTRWTLRVVNWAHDDTVDGLELRRLINGGPPSLRDNGARRMPTPKDLP
jgi:transposase-like protein